MCTVAMERSVRFEFLTSPSSSGEIIERFCPPVQAWWRSRFAEMSAPQRLAVPAIDEGHHTLVCAPTGSGKTLCAFISILSDLFARHDAGYDALGDHVDTLYISPLRALGTDVTKNLTTPLSEIATALGIAPPVRVAQRSGDTPQKDRARILRQPPHILVTTPESLALCLAQPKMRDHLRHVRRIIVDELHSLAPNKRGTDLMLSLERLSDLVMTSGNADPQRIGLSATIAPLERMAEFLVGSEMMARPCAIADASFDRSLDLQIASVFGKTPFNTTATINKHVYDLLENTIRDHHTTLIFTNLRSATERVTFALRKRFAAAIEKGEHDDLIPPQQIEAHHSSLDRDIRLDIERRLKAGELRCVVCSTSLELGIDIGTIDRVVLLNSPKGVARGLQRVGRSGHHLAATARGTFVPTVPSDLIESMVTADAMRKRLVDSITIPKNCLDVLAQHLIGMALQAQPNGIHTDHAFEIVRRSHSFGTLTREQFDRTVRFVATHDLLDTARVGAKLFLEEKALRHKGTEALRDGEEGPPTNAPTSSLSASVPQCLSAFLHPLRRSIAGLYAQNIGTITQEGQVKVKIKDGAVIGGIEEAFAQVLKPGDRFLLGGRCVRFIGAKGMTAEVRESTGQTPTVPRWFSGTMAMERGLAQRMRDFRSRVRAIAPAGEAAIARMLIRQFAIGEDVAKIAAAFLNAQFRYADIPTDGQLLVERVPDEEATVLVFHTMIGRAANDALARVMAYRMHKRFGGNATVVVDDYAFGIWVQSAAARRADRTLIRSLLAADTFDADLAAALETSELFRSQFRFTALRAHALLQNHFGRRRFVGQMQGYAGRLYEALRDFHPDHLLLTETRRTVTEDLLAAPDAREFLTTLATQGLRLLDLPSPSPFAFGLFATGRRDTLQLADTADFLLAMYEQVQRRLNNSPRPGAPMQSEIFTTT